LYEEYGIGFGILSLQAKESKHAGLKTGLSLTNRSRDSSSNGKWWQVVRASYIRSFYLQNTSLHYHPIHPILSHVSHLITNHSTFVTVVEKNMQLVLLNALLAKHVCVL
jgi:hypothetical protein